MLLLHWCPFQTNMYSSIKANLIGDLYYYISKWEMAEMLIATELKLSALGALKLLDTELQKHFGVKAGINDQSDCAHNLDIGAPTRLLQKLLPHRISWR